MVVVLPRHRVADAAMTTTQAWILVAEVGVVALAALVGLLRK